MAKSGKICRGILELVLPDKEFGEIKIMNSRHPFLDDIEGEDDVERADDGSGREKGALSDLMSEPQKTLKFESDAHGVRLMRFSRATNYGRKWRSRPARARRLTSGQDTIMPTWIWTSSSKGGLTTISSRVMSSSFVIFDRFKRDEPVYFFRSWDVEKGLPLDDLSYTIVLNTKCSSEKVPEALKPFYEYLNDPKKNQASELTRMIDERVRKFNSDGWRKKYMTFEYMLNERERKGLELGIEQGRSEGRSEGEAKKRREIAKNPEAGRHSYGCNC